MALADWRTLCLFRVANCKWARRVLSRSWPTHWPTSVCGRRSICQPCLAPTTKLVHVRVSQAEMSACAIPTWLSEFKSVARRPRCSVTTANSAKSMRVECYLAARRMSTHRQVGTLIFGRRAHPVAIAPQKQLRLLSVVGCRRQAAALT